MLSTIGSLAAELWRTNVQLAPSLLAGLLLAGLLHVVLDRGQVFRHLGAPGLGSSIRAALWGVPLPLCSCGVMPAAWSLRREGASAGATTSFLVSTPQTGVDSLLPTVGMLGWPVALFKVVSAFLAGAVSGVMVDTLVGSRQLPKGEARTGREKRAGLPARIWRYSFGMILRETYGWLALGIFLSALIMVLIPRGYLAGWEPVQGPLGLVAALLLGTPMYVCSLASIPVAVGLMEAGLSPGAALVFLMAGPATNVATIGAVRKILGNRVVVVYVLSVVVFSLAGGLLLDAVMAPVDARTGDAVHPGGITGEVLGAALAGLMALALWKDLRARYGNGGESCPTR